MTDVISKTHFASITLIRLLGSSFSPININIDFKIPFNIYIIFNINIILNIFVRLKIIWFDENKVSCVMPGGNKINFANTIFFQICYSFKCLLFPSKITNAK
jgi:hypothetical protein